MPCCGFLRKKRSKSVPPGGTQVKDDNKNKKSQPQAVNQSQPNLTEQQNRRQVVEQEQTTNNSHLRDILVNARNHDKQFEDESMQIYPVPPQFQSPRASQYSSHNPEEEYDDEEDDDESEEDEDTKPPTKRSQENEDFLNELNKDLQDELKLRLAVPPKKPERTIADDLGESGLDSSGNVTIRNAGQNQNQNQNQDEFIRPPRPSTEAANQERSVNNNTVNVIRSQSNLNQTNVTSRDFDLSNVNEMSITSLQKLVETVNMEKNTVDTVREENRNLKSLIEDLKSEMLSREAKYKEENDALMSKVHQTLTKEAKSDTERDELMKLLSAKQQHANESLIQEQARLIESLRTRCDQYEKALSIRTGSIELQVKEYKDEITTLRAIVHRLSAELSSFQCKYPHESPSLQASLKKFELSPLPGTGPTPIWLINTKFLSPLIAAYDDRLIEKDEKLRLFKKKLNELTEKFEMILNENKELNSKLEKAYQLGRVNDTEGFNEINSIRNQAILVLEENKTLQEQVDLLRSKLGDAQKNSIIEINNLSKKIIVLDSEKLDLRNQLERIKLNYDDLTRRYNDLSTEAQSRVRLQEHLSQTGELKRKIDELDVYHKFELEQTGSKISTLEGEKKDLMIRNASLASENKRLLAENKVLDKALNDGIGRKTQRKIQQLEKQVETAELKERTAQSISKTLEKEIEKLTTERETLVNALKEAEIEIKKHHNRLAEESLKFVKLETKLEDFKDKSAQKLATVNEKLKKKDSEFGLVKLESDKRIADILNLLHKKQNEIDDLIKEKRQMEGELEMVWQSTLNENRNMRNAFLDVNRKIDGKIFTSSDYRLLLDD